MRRRPSRFGSRAFGSRAPSLVAAAAAWLAAARTVVGASPAPSDVGTIDPRAGQTASFIGDPVFAVAVVALIAVVAIAATLAWVRATGGPADPDEGR